MARSGTLPLLAAAALLVFSRVFGLSLVLPKFRDHYEGGLGLDPLWVGIAFGAYGLTMALAQFPYGILSDRVGRRPMLLAASLMFVGGSLLAAFADGAAWLVAGRLLQGLGAVSSVAMAAVGESVPAERRTMAMAVIGVMAGGGFMAGLVVGPGLYPVLGMQGLFLLTAVIGTVAGAGAFLLPGGRPVMNPLAKPAASPYAFAPLALAGMASNYLLLSTLFFLPDSDAATLAPMLLVALVVMGLASRVIDKAGLTWRPVPVLLALLAVGAWWLVQSAWFLAGALFFSSHAVLSATLPSNISRLAGASGGRAHGVQNVVAYSGSFLAGVMGGFFPHTPLVPLAIGGGVALVAGLWQVAARAHLDAPRAVAEPEG